MNRNQLKFWLSDKRVIVFFYLTLVTFSFEVFSQSPSRKSNLVFRHNIQSNAAGTTLSSSTNSAVKAQYIFGQTPLLGKFSLSGVDVHQGFIQPISFSSTTKQRLSLSVSVYPNPFEDHIQIDFYVVPLDEVHASLFDIRGRLILEKRFKNPTDRIELDLKQLANGKYFNKGKERPMTF